MIINYSDQELKKSEKSIFLGGPTPRKKEIESWRLRAIEILQELDYDGVVYVPELSTGEKLFDYTNQVDWETEALENSTIIVFWIPRKIPDMLGLTTNCEFGEWYKSGKVMYGRPRWAKGIKYLDYKYLNATSEQPFDKLYDLLKAAVEKVS